MSQNPFASANLGFKFKLLPTKEQVKALDHQMFVSNQAYNICLNLFKKQSEKNQKLEKHGRSYKTAVQYDKVVKRALRLRKISFSTVVTQQARINFQKAVKSTFTAKNVAERVNAIANAKTPKEKKKAYNLGFPNFKSSKNSRQSFVWNNQGIQLLEAENSKFATLRLMKMDLKFRYHRNFPENFKICSIVVSKEGSDYFVSFGIEFQIAVNLGISTKRVENLKSIGLDLNAYSIASSCDVSELFEDVSQKHLINNGAKNRKGLRFQLRRKILERKQSKRVLKALKNKSKLGKNHKKTQEKINKLQKNITNQKSDLYHKISNIITNQFDLIAVEDLKTKNMSKSSKGNELCHGKMVKQKSGLNRAILNASFYQFLAMLEYKSKLNDKIFVKVNPAYTSLECSICGNRDKKNRPKQDKFECTACGFKINPDIQAAQTILKRGLGVFGLGTSLCTSADAKSKSLLISEA